MHPYLIPLIKLFEQHADATNAAGMKTYMLNQFDFYGLKAPEWRKLSKDYFKQSLPPFEDVEAIIKDCWQHPKRELQYVAIELLYCYRKEWKKETTNIIEYILTLKSWWETVDHAATALTGPYFKLFPAQQKRITTKWNKAAIYGYNAAVSCFRKCISMKQMPNC